jgi:hypothetical protein
MFGPLEYFWSFDQVVAYFKKVDEKRGKEIKGTMLIENGHIQKFMLK